MSPAAPRAWWPVATALLLALAAAGCSFDSPPPPANPAPADVIALRPHDVYDGDFLLLASPSLVAGIPGEGPLSLPEIDRWLEDPRQHEPLAVTLPWHLREGAAAPRATEVQLTRAKIELGRQLFFDRRLSSTQRNMSCGDCHHPRDQFAHRGHNSDPSVRHGRAVPVVVQRVFGESQFWDGRAATLAEQALMPIAAPDEMRSTPEECAARLQALTGYRRQFERIYGGEVTPARIGDALAAFELCLLTGPAPYDEARRRRAAGEPVDPTLWPAAAERGRELFFGRAGCASCHAGPNFSDEAFHSVGIGLADADPDPGRYRVTRDERDFGAFKTPTLRNIAETGPYMHRGQLGSLEEVVAWYAAGPTPAEQRAPRGRRDARAGPLDLSPDDQAALVSFLRTLTGDLPPVATGRLPAD